MAGAPTGCNIRCGSLLAKIPTEPTGTAALARFESGAAFRKLLSGASSPAGNVDNGPGGAMPPLRPLLRALVLLLAAGGMTGRNRLAPGDVGDTVLSLVAGTAAGGGGGIATPRFTLGDGVAPVDKLLAGALDAAFAGDTDD